MGTLESGTFVKPDLAGVGDPQDPGRRIIVEENFTFERNPARQL